MVPKKLNKQYLLENSYGTYGIKINLCKNLTREEVRIIKRWENYENKIIYEININRILSLIER